VRSFDFSDLVRQEINQRNSDQVLVRKKRNEKKREAHYQNFFCFLPSTDPSKRRSNLPFTHHRGTDTTRKGGEEETFQPLCEEQMSCASDRTVINSLNLFPSRISRVIGGCLLFCLVLSWPVFTSDSLYFVPSPLLSCLFGAVGRAVSVSVSVSACLPFTVQD